MADGSDGQDSGSFRDPAGFIFWSKGKVYRQVNFAAEDAYTTLMQSGLYDDLVKAGQLIPHKEVANPNKGADAKLAFKTLRPDMVPFVSYPYEWSFDQLQTAALLTLDVMERALQHGMILKDASAYNVQFVGNRPVFIDTLSFDVYKEGDQWEGYKQFCEHFVAPLAVARYANQDVLKALRVNLDGLPLELACKLLPSRARLRPGLLAHLYLHNTSQKKHQGGGQAVAAAAKSRRMTPLAMRGLLSSLRTTVQKLRTPQSETEWGDYYNFTNYSDKSFKAKRKLVKDLLLRSGSPKLVWDLGANNGEFSEVAAEIGAYTIAFDVDTNAVSRNVHVKRSEQLKANILPLVQDLRNPSPALGWAHAERKSLVERGPADVVLALAIIHHLSIGNNLPFDKVAEFLSQVGRNVIIEFVPKGDSKVDHLLSSRKDIFGWYDAEHFEAAMGQYFKLIDKKVVKGSKRSLYLYKVK